MLIRSRLCSPVLEALLRILTGAIGSLQSAIESGSC